MIGVFWTGILARSWVRRALRYGAIALAIVLFLLSIRRAGERVGRIAERLETAEKANAIQRRMLEVAARRPRSRDDLVDRLRDGGVLKRPGRGRVRRSWNTVARLKRGRSRNWRCCRTDRPSSR